VAASHHNATLNNAASSYTTSVDSTDDPPETHMIVAARGASQVAMQAAAGGRLPFEGQLVPTCIDPPIELATDLSQGADQLEAEFLVQRDRYRVRLRYDGY